MRRREPLGDGSLARRSTSDFVKKTISSFSELIVASAGEAST